MFDVGNFFQMVLTTLDQIRTCAERGDTSHILKVIDKAEKTIKIIAKEI